MLPGATQTLKVSTTNRCCIEAHVVHRSAEFQANLGDDGKIQPGPEAKLADEQVGLFTSFVLNP